MLVLGAGLQGSACAFDLLQNCEVSEVRLADIHMEHLPDFLAPYSGKRLIPTPLDVRDREAVGALMRQSDAVMSAIPYYFNLDLARQAVDAGVQFCDLGGNTDIVFEQKKLDAEATAKGITVIPDCGLAPGMVNILAECGIKQLDAVDEVKIFVGGLPQNPEPPVRNGVRTQVKALSGREPIIFDAPVGELEAFHTAGGLSTMAFRYEGQIPSMEYKTLRYPGHAVIMEAIRDLGFLDRDPIDVKGGHVSPRDVAIATMGPRLTKPGSKDLVALRVTVRGAKGGKAAQIGWELVDFYDEQHGISAMMRTTGYSLSITGQMQARGDITLKGVHTPDECVPAEKYIAELGKRGVIIREISA